MVLVLTGAYLAWYWYPAATGDATSAGRAGALAGLSATISQWIQGRTTLISVLAVTAVLGAATLALVERRRRGRMAPVPGACCPPDTAPGPGGGTLGRDVGKSV